MGRERHTMSVARRTRRGFVLRAVLLIFLAMLAFATVEIVLRLVYREEEVSAGYWGRGAFEHDDLAGFRHAAGYRGTASRRGVFVTQPR